LLTGLDEYQLAAVTSSAAPLAILAPAGSGKTRVLTRRIAWRAREGSLDARHVLAVTFTRKAAGELAHRLTRLGVDTTVTAGTFHALALAQLRRRAEEAGREPPRVLDRKGRVLARLLGVPGARAAATIPDVAAEIEWAKARMITPEQYAAAASRAGRELPRPATELADLYDRYEREKRKRRVVDFDDLLWWCAHAIETDDAFAASQRWRFRHVFVDEFQDASALSVRLVAAWLGDRSDLCVVGDVSQAIYGFAGADASFLEEFDRHFPGAERITLHYNYRSTPQVVRAAASVLGRDHSTRAVRADGPVPALVAYDDDDAEAAGVARRLLDAQRRGVAWRDMAVLFRTNAQSARFERAFARVGVAYAMPGRGAFLDRPEVQVVVEQLERSEAARPRRPLQDHLSDLDAWGADLEARDAEGAAGSDALSAAVREEDARDAATTLARLGREYLETEGGRGTLAGFLAWAEVATRGEQDDAVHNGVGLLTFHRAKGLEWRIVCVTGLERGLVPIAYAQDDAALAEERRLLHVALSRAHDELHLSWARVRTLGDAPSPRTPSPWLDAPIAASAPGPADRVPDPQVALSDVRRTLAAARPPGPRPRRAARRAR
jgi:DNA helicase-2/ATP-dependent DNA helicase PcrA